MSPTSSPDAPAATASRCCCATCCRSTRCSTAPGSATPRSTRSAAIEADLRVLAAGTDLPLLPQAVAYADRVRAAGERRLVAHAYVRYLGDLNGGRIMQRRLALCLGEQAPVAFHEFPHMDDPDRFTQDYREMLDQAVRNATFEPVRQEALAAFSLNIALSEAVKTAADAAM